MGFDTAYDAITEEAGEDTGHRWAFGTGFSDPLAGVDASVPAGVIGSDLAAYCLMLGDDALVMSHRLQQWLARAPELEEETALANIGLDLLGQARLLLTRAGAADGTGRTEDDYAFTRTEREFRNVRLAEVTDADFAGLVARLLVFSTWRLALLDRLRQSADPVLAAVAAQGVRELAYHRDYAAQWVVRLGDGTDYSRQRMQAGLAAVAPLVDELFARSAAEDRLGGVAVDPAPLRVEFDDVLGEVLAAAGLSWPQAEPLALVSGQAGRDGVHTEAMGYLLAELQSVARAHRGLVVTRTADEISLTRARQIAGSVPDPELPMVTLADLGILREVEVSGSRVTVSLTPTYSGCPAVAEMRADLVSRLTEAGFGAVGFRTVLNPPWSSDWISPEGRRKLAAAGIAPPRSRPGLSRSDRSGGPVPLTLMTTHPAIECPACGSPDTVRTAAFGSTACKDLYRCQACAEPFEHVREI